MVHALEKAAALAAPGGRVIDLHPPSERAEFLVRSARGDAHAGWLEETDEGIEYTQAEQALAGVVSRGVLAVEGERRFDFLYHAPDAGELIRYLEATWRDAVISAAVRARLDELLAEAGPGGEVLLREQARMVRLRPASQRVLGTSAQKKPRRSPSSNPVARSPG